MLRRIAPVLVLFLACGTTVPDVPDGASDASAAPDGPADGAGAVDSGNGDARVLRGAYANPNNLDGGKGVTEALTQTLEGQVGHLDLELSYQAFSDPFPSPGQQAAMDHGRVPVVSLGCGDTTQNIVDGMDDTTFVVLIDNMKAVGRDIVLRWFWEMNLSKPGTAACLDPTYDVNGVFDPAHYIAAWRHLHSIAVKQGATRVHFFFCPSGGASMTMAQYYPGDDVVDINGFDVYEGHPGEGLQVTLAKAYAAASSASMNRPIWVGETGSTMQLGYIDGSTRAMLSANYPLVGAIIYFDSQGPNGNWSLTPDGIAGFAAFGK